MLRVIKSAGRAGVTHFSTRTFRWTDEVDKLLNSTWKTQGQLCLGSGPRLQLPLSFRVFELRWNCPMAPNQFSICYRVKDKLKLVGHRWQLPSESSSCMQGCLVELLTGHVTYDCRNTPRGWCLLLCLHVFCFLNVLDLNRGLSETICRVQTYLKRITVLLSKAQTLRRAATELQSGAQSVLLAIPMDSRESTASETLEWKLWEILVGRGQN